MPTRAATLSALPGSPVPLPTTAALATPVAATPASIADLLAARGAPTRVFTVVGNAIWAIDSDGEATRIFQAPAGTRIVSFDAAPGGEQVAALLQSGASGSLRSELTILDIGGRITARTNEFDAVLASATPTASGNQGQTIDWSPQGDRILISLPNGTLLGWSVAATEPPAVLAEPTAGGTIVTPEWAPTGEAIAFISAAADERSRILKRLNVGDGSVGDIVDPLAGRFVVDFAWMPDGNALLFTEGGELGGAVTGIDLWRVDADGANRELVVSAGTVAPVARITNMQPSPDGRSVAYSVLIPGSAGPRVDSVWVRDISTGLGFRISMPSVAAIAAIWWTDQGLAIDVRTGEPRSEQGLSQAILGVKRDGTVDVLWAAPVAQATPVGGTPIAPAIQG